MEKVSQNSTVTVNYTGKLEDGSIFDTSLVEGREPLKAKLGEGQLIPGFESGLVDMSIGESKTIEINPQDAYGEYDDTLVVEITKDKVPENVEVGTMLQTFGPMGPSIVKVLEIKDEVVVIDANHPLAGKKLTFELEVVGVE
jgi:FKBP-type peptidyl-prolyl cis-trans isomerase 2|tara:strand:+ start:4274 stop:4699 length:426 start_codon:yes stop_codon:yes gene_type:complete